jgi:hypothetical protein
VSAVTAGRWPFIGNQIGFHRHPVSLQTGQIVMRNKDLSWAAAAKKDSFFRNFGPENPKNIVINDQL